MLICSKPYSQDRVKMILSQAYLASRDRTVGEPRCAGIDSKMRRPEDPESSRAA